VHCTLLGGVLTFLCHVREASTLSDGLCQLFLADHVSQAAAVLAADLLLVLAGAVGACRWRLLLAGSTRLRCETSLQHMGLLHMHLHH
jgi:hypothetical protein